MENLKKKDTRKAHPHLRLLDNALLHPMEHSGRKNILAPVPPLKERGIARHLEEAKALGSHAKAAEPVQRARVSNNGKKVLSGRVEEEAVPVKRPPNNNGKKGKVALSRVEEPEAADLPEKAAEPVNRVPGNSKNVNVFEIISDLEKQLDAAFSLKDAQEKEIQDLRINLEDAEAKIHSLEIKLDESRSKSVSQEKMRLELAAFENERFEAVTEKKALKSEIEFKVASIKEMENKIAVLAQDSQGWNARIGQVELELANTNATIQSLRRQIFLLQDEKEVLSKKLETTEKELSAAITERDRSKRELQEAKESLEEIRLTLTQTQARAHGRYYKKQVKSEK